MLTNEVLREYFAYDPATGVLLRRDGVCSPTGIGKDLRYLAISFGGKRYYVHRLAWQYIHDEVPGMIDHADGDPRNNRIENLRLCTNAQNQYNAPKKSHNRSGFKGVAFCTGYRKPWRARIVVNKRVVLLGYFDTAEKAAEAYAAGAAKHAGEFSRP